MSETIETDTISMDTAGTLIAAAFKAGEAKGRAGSSVAQDRRLASDRKPRLMVEDRDARAALLTGDAARKHTAPSGRNFGKGNS